MDRLIQRFKRAHKMRYDSYVADYNEATGSRVGVKIKELEPFDDIECFRLQRGRHEVPYYAINLEEHAAFIKHMPSCECFFVSAGRCEKPWLLLLELKYCKAKNLPLHASKAVHQMTSVLRKLDDEGLVNPRRFRIYFNYSSPGNNVRQPFTHFMHTPADALDLLDRYDAYFLGFNHLIIAGPQYIRAPKMRI